MERSGTIWIKIPKFLTTKKTLNTTKITISQKIPFFKILNFYKKSLKLPLHKNYHFLPFFLTTTYYLIKHEKHL